MPEGNQRQRVLYSGRVQGVGFRYTARQIAQRHAVTGWVRNMSDGRVELLIEGAATDVEHVLQDIASAMSDHIRDVDAQLGPATSQYTSFEVAF